MMFQMCLLIVVYLLHVIVVRSNSLCLEQITSKEMLFLNLKVTPCWNEGPNSLYLDHQFCSTLV